MYVTSLYFLQYYDHEYFKRSTVPFVIGSRRISINKYLPWAKSPIKFDVTTVQNRHIAEIHQNERSVFHFFLSSYVRQSDRRTRY